MKLVMSLLFFLTVSQAFAHKPVDILFVVDNSASMEFEQEKLAERFEGFIKKISHLHWRIGITTTDCSGGMFSMCGTLLDIHNHGSNTQWFDIDTPNHKEIFENNIYRPETVGCVLTGHCPSGIEEALKATKLAFEKSKTTNKGFFRPYADLAVVILTDEDERSQGDELATTPDQVLGSFKNHGKQKKLQVNSIIVRPNDSACLAKQQKQSIGMNGHYGYFANELSHLTNGVVGDVCSEDYSDIVNKMSENIRELASK